MQQLQTHIASDENLLRKLNERHVAYHKEYHWH